MPDTTSPSTTEAAPSKGGPKRLIIMGVLCALICGAGFVLGGRMAGGGATAAEPVEEPAEDEEPTIDEIVKLDPLNINLAEGHYLRIAVAVGLAHHADEEESSGGGGHGGGDEEEGPSIPTAPASDLVLTTFAGRDMHDLSTPEGRELARHDLLEGLVEYYGEDVVTVLFTEFVMQ